MKTLTRWNQNHPQLRCNNDAEQFKKELRNMPKKDFEEFSVPYIETNTNEPVPHGRPQRTALCIAIQKRVWKENYLKQSCLGLFAKKYTDKTGEDLFAWILDPQQKSLLDMYNTWRAKAKAMLEERNEIIQVLPHNMNAACQRDTDGDGDCFICHEREGGCVERPKQQRPFGWRVKSDTSNNYFLYKGDAISRGIELIAEGAIT